MGGNSKTTFNVFLPAYYGCIVTPQSGSASPVSFNGSFSFKVDLLPTHGNSNLVVTANNKLLTPTDGIYTISNILADQIVRITGLAFNTFSITASAKANGTITPEGEVSVNQGGLQFFEIRPNNGYSVDKVFVDEIDQGNIKSYTFKNVTATHTINATFKKGSLYTINTSEDELFFETTTGVPSDSAIVVISSPDVPKNISITAPNRFQISANGSTWQSAFLVQPNKLPFNLYIRFYPSGEEGNVGTFNEVLELKTEETYAEIKLTGLSHLGINDDESIQNIDVYPNPTTGELTITNYELRITNVEIFDVYGRKVFATANLLPQTANQIDISNLSAGVYLITIHTDKGIVHKKVVKE
jgi:hypothetical protein